MASSSTKQNPPTSNTIQDHPPTPKLVRFRSKGPTVSGLAEVEARTPEDIMGLLRQGNLSRTQQATRANAVSSRSHAVLQVGVA